MSDTILTILEEEMAKEGKYPMKKIGTWEETRVGSYDKGWRMECVSSLLPKEAPRFALVSSQFLDEHFPQLDSRQIELVEAGECSVYLPINPQELHSRID